MNLLNQRGLNLAAYKRLRADVPQSARYPAYPEPGGVLPWAHTENGDVLYWLTEGPPDEWPIIVVEARHASLRRYDTTTTEFLAQVLEGRLDPDIFPTPLELVGAAPYVNLTG